MIPTGANIVRLILLSCVLAAVAIAGCGKDGGRLSTRPDDIPDGFLNLDEQQVPLFTVITPLELPLDIRHTLERDGWDESFPVAYSIEDGDMISELSQTLFININNLPRNIPIVWVGWIDQARPSVAETVRQMQQIENSQDYGDKFQVR